LSGLGVLIFCLDGRCMPGRKFQAERQGKVW